MILDTVPSYAKLNLSLLVYQPRRDGYHPICSVFQQIELHDQLVIKHADTNSVSVNSPSLHHRPNILDRVFELIGARLKRAYHVHIIKNIPVGAGLGGGSSNAASLLLWLNQNEALGLTHAQLSKIALRLGADVPFFLTGGTALVRGIGEKIRPIDIRVSSYYLLINPGHHLDTPSIFHQFDQVKGAKKAGPTPVSVRNGDVGQNSFKPIVWEILPELARLEAELTDRFNLTLHLSGSGATVFVCMDNLDDATVVQNWVGLMFPKYWTQLSRPKSRYDGLVRKSGAKYFGDV